MTSRRKDSQAPSHHHLQNYARMEPSLGGLKKETNCHCHNPVPSLKSSAMTTTGTENPTQRESKDAPRPRRIVHEGGVRKTGTAWCRDALTPRKGRSLARGRLTCVEIRSACRFSHPRRRSCAYPSPVADSRRRGHDGVGRPHPAGVEWRMLWGRALGLSLGGLFAGFYSEEIALWGKHCGRESAFVSERVRLWHFRLY